MPHKLKTHVKGATSILLTFLFVHLLTSLTTKTFLSYGINVRDNNGPEKSLKTKFDI